MRRRGLACSLFVVCAAAGVLSAALLAAAPSAIADTHTGTTGTTTAPPPPTTSTTSTTPTVPRPTTIAAGVTVGGEVLVGGLSPAAATAEVKTFFARPLTVKIGKTTLRRTPRQLGASADVAEAVRRARLAAPGANVPLKVTAPQEHLEWYVRMLAKRFDRKPVDARLLVRDAKPFVTKEQPGQRLRQLLAVRDLYRSLKTHVRDPLVLRPEAVRPTTTRTSVGDVIVIRRSLNRLFLYDGMKLRRAFGVATGLPQYPTPLGSFRIIVKWRNPWWYPPQSDWAKNAKPIPPGPGNPLGTRWMGISSPAIGIHGTPDAASIGYSASHGCIRMRVPEAEWLFNQVDVGTPVYILR